jgi:hypothetical protein
MKSFRIAAVGLALATVAATSAFAGDSSELRRQQDEFWAIVNGHTHSEDGTATIEGRQAAPLDRDSSASKRSESTPYQNPYLNLQTDRDQGN